MTNPNRKVSIKRLYLPYRVVLLAILLCSLLLVACSETPTTMPNPLTIPAHAGATTTATEGTGPSAEATTPTPTQMIVSASAGTITATTEIATIGSSAAAATPIPSDSGQSDSSGSGSSSSSLATPTLVGQDQRLVLTMWTSGWKGNPDYEIFLNNLVDTYRSKYFKNFTLDWQDFGNDLPAQLVDTFAKNPPAVPDLVLLSPGDLYQFAADNKLENLGTMVGTDGQNRFSPPAWEAMRYGSGDTSGIYGLPWVASTRVSIINKKLWQTATLDPAKLPKNFDELDQYLTQMRDYTPSDVRSVWLHPDPVADFMMEDVPLYQVNSGGKKEAAFNIGAAQGKWQYYFNRRRDGYFTPEALDGTYKDALTRYSAGKLVMVMDGAPLLPGLKAQNPDLYNNTLVTLHPLSKANMLPLQIQGWAVPKMAANKRDAVDFALFLDNDENQLAFAKFLQIVIPTTKKSLTDAYVTGGDDPIAQVRAIMARSLPLTRPPEQLIPAPVPLATRDKLLNALYIAQSAIWNKAVKPQDALTEASKAWADLLK